MATVQRDGRFGEHGALPQNPHRRTAVGQRRLLDLAARGEVLDDNLFTKPGQFVWHCHIVEHEDNEMMRPYRIGPLQPGQPE